MRKILSIALVIVIAFTVSAPRAAATGVGGTALTVAEMAGVVSLIAGSLGIVFTGAGDMHDACEAFIRGLDPNSAAYLALASAVAQGSTIYIAGSNAVNYLPGLVDSIRSFFLPGGDVVVEGSGVSITNLGQIATSRDAITDSVAKFTVTETPVVFSGPNGDFVGSVSISRSVVSTATGSSGPYTTYKYDAVTVTPQYGSETSETYAADYEKYDPQFLYFAHNGMYIQAFVRYYLWNGGATSLPVGTPPRIEYSLVASVSGGGEEAIDIPVFQEAGALSPDLVGGVWDKLAEDAAAQNGNVTIDTNVGTYQGGATGYVDGDPNGVIAAPQAPSLGGAGSTKTETDTSTGTTTQTQTQTGAQAVPQADTANPAITDVQTQTTFNGAALTLADIFPFCIPFDVYWMLKGLSVPREAPSFEIPIQLGSWLNFSHTFEFDQYEQYAQVLRSGELAVFVIGLAAATRKFIKW